MRRHAILAVCLLLGCLILGGKGVYAQCAIPNSLANGNVADATQVMANFNAELACINNQLPAGSTNSLQYNGGSGAFGSVGPLTNGQLVIGSTGNAPQAGTLTAGAGIAITNAPGSITIATTGGGSGGGLYNQVLSATPTSAGTGLTNWLNQGSATVADSSVGICINAPAATANVTARYAAAPTPPYTITALISGTRNALSYNNIGIGWYDGTNKLHVIAYTVANSGFPFLEVSRWNSPTSYNSDDFTGNQFDLAEPIWLQIADDGTNVSFGFSQDGANFLTLYSVAKSSGWLGSSGYNNVMFWVSPQGGQQLATLMSWAQH